MNLMQPTLTAGESAVQTEHEFQATTQPLKNAWEDGRRFPRFHLRVCIEATVHPPTNEPEQQVQHCQMLTRDISRGGMNILHKTQLFPGQLVDVVLHDGNRRRLEVKWCRRLGVGCYTAGCRFVRTDEGGAETTG
jgi:hypothetical protein